MTMDVDHIITKSQRLAKRWDIIGWREWANIPDLGIERVKAKIDTGARTSALHAMHLQTFKHQGETFVRFRVHPTQRRRRPEILCEAKLKDIRSVKNSGGQTEERYVIETTITIGKHDFTVEINLTNRAPMGFRMLLGRTALHRRFLVNPGASYLLSRPQTAHKPE